MSDQPFVANMSKQGPRPGPMRATLSPAPMPEQARDEAFARAHLQVSEDTSATFTDGDRTETVHKHEDGSLTAEVSATDSADDAADNADDATQSPTVPMPAGPVEVSYGATGI